VHAADLCVARSADRAGGLAVRVGVPLADVYLEFLGGRCRPNTVLAAAYDLKVFFTVVGKPPQAVRSFLTSSTARGLRRRISHPDRPGRRRRRRGEVNNGVQRDG
jgi:hypothetical protein